MHLCLYGRSRLESRELPPAAACATDALSFEAHWAADGQWVTACSCYRDDEWRAGGATFTAFRFVDSPPGHVDFVAVSLHLTHREPAVRARGAAEMLRPLVRLLKRRFDGAPVILGGDFNTTKLQSADKSDKRQLGGLADRSTKWLAGAYGTLCGDVVANKATRGMHEPKDHDSSYNGSGDEDDEDEEPNCADTWELARANGKRNFANECKASTCHNWRGLSWYYVKHQVCSPGRLCRRLPMLVCHSSGLRY